MNKLLPVLLAAGFAIFQSNIATAAEPIPEQYRNLVMDLFKVSKAPEKKVSVTKAKPRKKVVKKQATKKKFRNTLKVRASAYNSLRGQTDSTPNIAAWGDRLKPGMKIIAVSRDMLTKYGMKHNTVVKIKGLPGTYRVADKMNKRYRKTIDIYMGKDRRKAMKWGRRTVTIMW